jgi:hypothetical protein
MVRNFLIGVATFSSEELDGYLSLFELISVFKNKVTVLTDGLVESQHEWQTVLLS